MTDFIRKYNINLRFDTTVLVIYSLAFHIHNMCKKTLTEKKENKNFPRFAFLKFFSTTHCTHFFCTASKSQFFAKVKECNFANATLVCA